jgi:cytochrome c peroxidase
MMKQFIYTCTLALLLGACAKDKLANPLDVRLEKQIKAVAPDGSLDYFVLPESGDLAALPQGVNNPITQEKINLGKFLFFETGLALDPMNEAGKGTYSCGTCHVPSAGFMPGRIQGIADGGVGFGYNGEGRNKMDDYLEDELDVQDARPLSLLNVTYVKNTSWSGQFGAYGINEGTEEVWDLDEVTEVNHLGLDGLESQNIEGLKLHRMVINKTVLDTLGYTDLYDTAFSDVDEEERYTPVTTSLAISAYLRSVITNRAPFQQWLKGDVNALNEAEKRGALVFFSKAGCFRCHKGPSLNGTDFYALGVKDLYDAGGFKTTPNDKRSMGRGGFTREAEDMYKFKIPQLYNMKDSPFYFHGSSKRSLREVVEYFNEAIPENDRVPQSQIAPQFEPLNLTEQEIEDLTKFLEDGLRDPDLDRYMPEEIPSGLCFPNNDQQSRSDLGCN